MNPLAKLVFATLHQPTRVFIGKTTDSFLNRIKRYQTRFDPKTDQELSQWAKR